MKLRTTLAALAAIALLTGAAAVPDDHAAPRADRIDEVLGAGDGWGSQNGGTHGGSGGVVYDVSTRAQFRAHAGGTTPRILRLHGTISAFDVAGTGAVDAPSCADIERQVTVALPTGAVPFTMRGFIDHAALDRDTPPSGPWEEARLRAAALQTAQVRVTIGSNVTIIGDGHATIVGAHLYVNRAKQVILRDFASSDAYDCFPEWDPLDGASGNWNALYDNVSIMNDTENVWVDHLTLGDGAHGPGTLPTELGRKFEVHDGLLDITHGSSYVTVSNSLLYNHDKTSLVGSSDNRPADTGRLKVTWRTNLFYDLGQRAPRVRYGDVDVYNNLYRYDDAGLFQYAIGVGAQSSVIAERNAFILNGMDTSRLLRAFGGTQIRMDDNLVNRAHVDVLAAYNATASTPLANQARWSDPHRSFLLPVQEVESYVLRNAGAGALN